MKVIGFLALVVLVLGVGLMIAGRFGFPAGTPPQTLGLSDGRLAPPSRNPNSVSSQTALHPDHPQKEYAAIAPFRFTGDGDSAMNRLTEILQRSELTIVVKREPGYVYAQINAVWLKFTDDMEFLLDKPGGVIHVRSSSRLGRKDFGANRARIEAIRAQL